jgi:uncharacterized protein YeaO (DUF488 family)
MSIRIVRLGSPRSHAEGLRLGTVRRPPRGVRKQDYAARDYFDTWLPDLAPSAQWVGWAHAEPFTPQRWRRYVKNYRREMQDPAHRRILTLLARLSHHVNFSVGCYCEHENRCHRSILRALLIEHGAKVVSGKRAAKSASTQRKMHKIPSRRTRT